ncbi:MAG: GNAT family N-acetyltransferase [Opitutales bacterium]|nr:GNAT family N-acetyltransferase [Opitutales bacterium]
MKAKEYPQWQVRNADSADVEALVQLNELCYPLPGEKSARWTAAHLESHLQHFPEGQMVVEKDGVIIGAASSLMVHMGKDPHRAHTWAGITDGGFFSNHDAFGTTLYGVDLYVHPDFRGQGVARALYRARRELARRKNIRRILVGARLWHYDEYADKTSPEEYAERVVQREIEDPVLGTLLREGYVLRGILPHYSPDPRSRNFAALFEWLNPEHEAPSREVRKARISCVQYQMRKLGSFDEFAAQVKYFVEIAAEYGSDFVLLPEFLSVQLLSQTGTHTPQEGVRKLAELTPDFRQLMKGLAVRYGITLISGSHPVAREDKMFNVCFVCLPDGTVVEQPKLHITPNESKWWQITGGDCLRVIETPKARIGIQICYDIEFPEASRWLADQGVDIIFVPFCTDNRQGYLRVRYCAQARAIENQVYVALAGTVGNLPDVSNMDIQYAQAAVLTPSDFAFARDAIAAEADYNEETILVCDVNLDDLYEAREHGSVTPRLNRRTDLFTYQAKLTNSGRGNLPEVSPDGDVTPLGLGTE